MTLAMSMWAPEELDAELRFALQRTPGVNWLEPVEATLRLLGGIDEQRPAIAWETWQQSDWYGPIDSWVRPPQQVSDICIDPSGDVLVRERSSRVFLGTGVRIGRAWADWLQAVIALRSGFASADSPLDWRNREGKPLLAIHGAYARRFRFALTRPPYTPDGPTVTLRMLATSWPKLDDLVRTNVLSRDAADFLTLVMERGGTIVISGATASGKTTLAGALLQEASHTLNRRIIQIEDACELPAPVQGFSVEVLRSGMTFTECVRMALRQNPDMIVLGEVRGAEALAMLQAAATGHPGVATIHADHARAGLANLERLAASDPQTDPLFVRTLMSGGAAPMIAVHIMQVHGRRRVTEIVEPLVMVGASPGDPLPYNIVFQYDSQNDRLAFRFPPTGAWLH